MKTAEEGTTVQMPAVCFRNFRPNDPSLSHVVEAGVIKIDDDNKPVPENNPVIGYQYRKIFSIQ